MNAEEKLPTGFAIVLLEIDETTPADVMLHIQAAVTRAESAIQPPPRNHRPNQRGNA